MTQIILDSKDIATVGIQDVSFEEIDALEKKLGITRKQEVNIGGNCFHTLTTKIGNVKLIFVSKAFR